jgi:mRNA interferase YafQ
VARKKAKDPGLPPSPPPAPPPPLKTVESAAFHKDVKRLKKGRKDMRKLRAVIELLCSHERLSDRHRDHQLEGDWKGWRDCHIEGNWLLIYRITGGTLELARTGSHSEVLRK